MHRLVALVVTAAALITTSQQFAVPALATASDAGSGIRVTSVSYVPAEDPAELDHVELEVDGSPAVLRIRLRPEGPTLTCDKAAGVWLCPATGTAVAGIAGLEVVL